MTNYILTLTVVLILTSCTYRNEKKISSSKVIPHKNSYKERVIGERKTIEKHDKVYLFGGTKAFISSHFDNDSCSGIVEGVFSYCGQESQRHIEAILKMEVPIIINHKTLQYMAFSLYYFDSKYGYDKSSIRLLDHLPSKAEYDTTCYGPTVDDDVIFRIKK